MNNKLNCGTMAFSVMGATFLRTEHVMELTELNKATYLKTAVISSWMSTTMKIKKDLGFVKDAFNFFTGTGILIPV